MSFIPDIPYPATDYFELAYPVIVSTMLILVILFSVLFYLKIRIFVVMLVMFLFSIIFSFTAMTVNGVPFTPYFQIMTMLITGILFLETAYQTFFKEYKN